MAIQTIPTPLRLGTAAEWAASTLVMGDGEVGFDTTNNIFKYGDGTNTWASLSGSGVVAGGNSGTAKTVPDSVLGGGYTLTLTGALVITFPTLTAGATFKASLTQDATGTRLVTWPAAVKWPAATAPTLSTAAGKIDQFEFFSFDGTTWTGHTIGLDVR